MTGEARVIGLGVVGGGMVSQACHIANFVTIPGCRVVGLAELRPELGRRVAAKFGIERVYPSHRELLDDPDVEAVVVVTRRPATGPVVLDCLRAGRDVLSEKPMAHTVEQARRLVDAAREGRRRYVVGMMKRHDRGVARAAEILRSLKVSGDLGAILLVRAHCHGGSPGTITGEQAVMTDEIRPDGLVTWPVAPDWLAEGYHGDYAGFLNVQVHMLNLLRYLLGQTLTPVAADLRQGNGKIALMRCGHIPVSFDMADIAGAEWSEGVEVIFERGRLRLDLPPPFSQDMAARVRVTGMDGFGGGNDLAGWAFRRQAEAFIQLLRFGAPSIADGDDCLHDLDVAESIWSSGADGLETR
jgi:predicted dehydrogenase